MEMQSYCEDNERLVKDQEEKNHLNAAMLSSLIYIQLRINSWSGEKNPEGSKSSTKRIRKRSSSGSSDSGEPTGGSSSSSHKNKRKSRYQSFLRDEFRKARSPTFNGDIKNDQEAEAWLLGTRKYFQVQDYSRNMKARVAIFIFSGRASILWEHFRKVNNIRDRNIMWKHFQKFFQLEVPL